MLSNIEKKDIGLIVYSVFVLGVVEIEGLITSVEGVKFVYIGIRCLAPNFQRTLFILSICPRVPFCFNLIRNLPGCRGSMSHLRGLVQVSKHETSDQWWNGYDNENHQHQSCFLPLKRLNVFSYRKYVQWWDKNMDRGL